MQTFKLCLTILIVLGMVLILGGCSDLDKYRKPAEEQTEAPEKTAPQLHSVDIRGSAAEQQRGRDFKITLDRIRNEFAQNPDTVATITALDSLLFACSDERKALAEGSEFGTFYLLMMADILNQVAGLRRGIGDIDGAREAQAKLSEIRNNLPH